MKTNKKAEIEITPEDSFDGSSESLDDVPDMK